MAEVLGSIMQIAMPAMTAAGTAGNIYSNVKQGQTANLQQQQLKNQLSYQNDPSKMAALVKSLKIPMSESMIQALARSSGAMTGAAGLGDSPGLATYIAGQAAAPYEQQSNEQAIQQAMQLIMGGNAGTPQYPTANMSGSFANLMKQYPQYFGKGGGGGGGSPLPNTTDPGGSIGDIGIPQD